LKIFGIANYYIHVTFPCDNVTVFWSFKAKYKKYTVVYRVSR
jgi:hypothetical protein